MVRSVRIGVVGCGSVMQGPYSRQINQLKQRGLIETVVACDVKDERRNLMLSHDYGYQRFTNDFEEVIGADDIDLVLVLTSMRKHGQLTRAALEAGKHVLVEKPMSTSLEEAAQIVELARTSAGYLVPAPHVILSP